ncbi:MAG TPA: hypothetical protein VEG39_03000 [Clostridia bacterium]|nr:hypothetical protein [Clostridia bacterium]
MYLLQDPLDDNQLGIIFVDGFILPIGFIIFSHYIKKGNHWKMSYIFAMFLSILEWIIYKLKYLIYINWELAHSIAIYALGFRAGAHMADRIVSYDPPIPYPVRLYCFSYAAIAWVGALFGWPVLKLLQFRIGLFNSIMADDRFVDLYSGMALSLICALMVPRASRRMKPVMLAIVACIGTAFAVYFNFRGWLIYHHWNNLLTAIRYIISFALIMWYDRWESSYMPKRFLFEL